jgi:hypothetical protein
VWKRAPRCKSFALLTASSSGYLNPGPALGGVDVTGWVDMPNALSAFRRSNGEYLVFVEEDYRNKVISIGGGPRKAATRLIHKAQLCSTTTKALRVFGGAPLCWSCVVQA